MLPMRDSTPPIKYPLINISLIDLYVPDLISQKTILLSKSPNYPQKLY